jgi:ERCC4-type nuclease
MVKIQIDYREKSLISLISVPIEVVNLEMGDVQIIKDDKPLIIIERKSVSDLNSSIRDGRYHEQKHRLIHNVDRQRIVYIIEGAIPDSQHKFIDRDKVYSGILHTIFRDGLIVYRTENIVETAEFINELANRVIKKTEDWVGFLDGNGANHVVEMDKKVYDKVSSKKSDNNTPTVAFINMVAQIPGCSTKIGEKLVETYKTMPELIKVLDNGGINSLKDLPLENRKLGPVLSSRIYNYFFGIIPDS